jgi:hypothetical protein
MLIETLMEMDVVDKLVLLSLELAFSGLFLACRLEFVIFILFQVFRKGDPLAFYPTKVLTRLGRLPECCH